MCGLLDCLRTSMTLLQRHVLACSLVIFFMVYCVVMTFRLTMITNPAILQSGSDASDDQATLTKRLTPFVFDAVDLPSSKDQSTSSAAQNGGVPLVHITWFYPPQTPLRFHKALAVLAVQRYARPRKILLWYDSASTPPVGRWWQFARQSIAHLLPVPYLRPTSVFNRTVAVPEHQSDVARLALIEEHGGLYIDLDVILVRPLDSLLGHDLVLGAETPHLLGSGFILARRPRTEFVRLWWSSYADSFNDSRWNEHACKVPMLLARRHPHLLHVEWFSLHRPNWYGRHWLYADGRLWDWSSNYAVHLWFRTHPRGNSYDPITIRQLNTTTGEILRHIYYGDTRILPPVAYEYNRTHSSFNRTIA